MTGIERIAAERKRQIEEEGFTAEHDDQFKREELAMAALCYIVPNSYREWPPFNVLWPFDKEWWKPTPNRVRELEKAGAFCAAEIDRLQRLEERQKGIKENRRKV
jgi:hypothetical protein